MNVMSVNNVSLGKTVSSKLGEKNESTPIVDGPLKGSEKLQNSMKAMDSLGRASVNFRGETIFGPDSEDDSASKVYRNNLKALMKSDNMSIKGAKVASVILDIFEDHEELHHILNSEKFVEGLSELKTMPTREFDKMKKDDIYTVLTGEKKSIL